jgi:hypothetical protein
MLDVLDLRTSQRQSLGGTVNTMKMKAIVEVVDRSRRLVSSCSDTELKSLSTKCFGKSWFWLACQAH